MPIEAMGKYIGIDYGTKRVGIAVSDDSGAIAFPRITLANDATLLPAILALIKEERIGVAVVGESKDKDGKDNPVMAAARAFAKELERAAGVELHFEPEYYSSVEARKGVSDTLIDAKAAAVILNRYLERIRQNVSG